METKKWYLSRTLYVNAIAVIAAVVAGVSGYEISAEMTTGALAVINMVMRAITTQGIE